MNKDEEFIRLMQTPTVIYTVPNPTINHRGNTP